jgi:p-methyltransferase
MGLDCLIISYSEPSRDRERSQFFNEDTKTGSGWGRFLHSNYVRFGEDILLPSQLASVARLTRERGAVERDAKGFFKEEDISFYSAWKIPLLGGLFLYQHLKSLALDVAIIQHAQFEKEQLAKCLVQKPRVIAISTTLLLNPLDIAQLVRACRAASPESLIVLGGVGIWNSYWARPDDINMFKAYRADCVVVDPRGFKTLGKLVNAVIENEPLSNVDNLIIYSRSGVTATPRRPEEYDFTLDAIRWDLIEDDLMGRISLLRTQISCPFSCSFCSYPTSQGQVIAAGMTDIENELSALEQKGVKYLLFVDDTFNVPPARFREILAILKKFDFIWYAFIRCQFLDADQARDMKESGCEGVYLGMESASDDILKAMNKRATVAEYQRGVSLLKEQGIITYASFIVGFPGETEATVDDTRRFIETSGIDFYNVKIFYYDQTTPIAARSREFGLTGQGMNWTHRTMRSDEAFAHMERIIAGVADVPYIPQHSGEIWELAYLREQGFSREDVRRLYRNFTLMLKDGLNSDPQAVPHQEQLFAELVKCS